MQFASKPTAIYDNYYPSQLTSARKQPGRQAPIGHMSAIRESHDSGLSDLQSIKIGNDFKFLEILIHNGTGRLCVALPMTRFHF